MIENKEWDANKFPKMKENLLEILNIEYSHDKEIIKKSRKFRKCE